MPIKSHLVETFFGLKSGYLSSFTEFDDVVTVSRNVSKKHLFFALPGVSSNGWDYLANIAEQGCRVVILPRGVDYDKELNLVVILVDDVLDVLAAFIRQFASAYPANVCAVTGTNGKSSISFYNAQIAQNMGLSAAIVGTFGVGTLDRLSPSEQTTPDFLSMHTLAIQFAENKVDHLTFEASSHALHQGRIHGLPIDTAIYTNLSRDHLDYHGSMEEYAKAKAKLFTFPSLKRAVICVDDVFSELMIQSSVCPVYRYSLLDKTAEFFASNIQYQSAGVMFDLAVMGQTYSVNLPLLGEFNVANAVAALAANWDLFENKEALIACLSSLQGAPGRMEMVKSANAPLIVVDYAHTPAAMEVALKGLRLHNKGKLVCVYGCGGDRDRGKRPLMTEVALCYSDQACLTSDNPRTESVQQILNDAQNIQDDVDDLVAKGAFKVIADRRDAIMTVIAEADIDDVILIAGKGHENYQDIAGVKHHFDDAEVALEGVNKCWSN